MVHSEIRAFVFDLDGVIVDTAIYHFRSWRALAQQLSFDIPDALNHDLKGLGRMESLALVLEHAPADADLPGNAELAALKNDMYQVSIADLNPDSILPGVQAFLTSAKELGIRLALGSGSKNARMILDRIGLTPMFDAICDGTDITRSKPDPQVFECACLKLGIDPRDVIIFEDAVSGIQAARTCGAIPIGIGDPAILIEAEIVLDGFDQITPRLILEQLKENS